MQIKLFFNHKNDKSTSYEFNYILLFYIYIRDDNKSKKTLIHSTNDKSIPSKGKDNKKLMGLYTDLLEKKETTSNKLKNMMMMLNHPPIQMEKNNNTFFDYIHTTQT